jgi:hypothetical protein
VNLPTHLFVPDTQSKPGTPNDHLRWLGKYILERKPDVVIHAGDHWDMPSLSSYNSKWQLEGQRYSADVQKGNDDFDLLTAPTRQYNARARTTVPYEPRKVLLRGNHEFRIERAVGEDPRLEGSIGYHHLESPGWEVHDFLKPVFIDGVAYSHFFANPMTGRPYGGMVETMLKNIGTSFTMGHVQTFRTGSIPVLAPEGSQMRRGLIAGAFYIHDEDYKGHQGNGHWRGCVVKHQVSEGNYDIMEVSLDYLCRKYEGVDLATFKTENGY